MSKENKQVKEGGEQYSEDLVRIAEALLKMGLPTQLSEEARSLILSDMNDRKTTQERTTP